jgi:hypothetical protein
MKKRILCFLLIITFLPSMVFAQKDAARSKKKVTITGTVTDMNNKPVEGVEIYIDSVITGYTTNYQGKFKINVKSDANNLFVISPDHGFSSAEIKGQANIILTLNGNTREIPAFVSEERKKNESKPVSKVKKVNTYTDIYQMIRHEVPGVVVSGRNIVVQGPNSFYGSTQPLFVVNGSIVNNIDYISPVEVKSIVLLKGSYAAKYGVEGANGVISITLFSAADRNK